MCSSTTRSCKTGRAEWFTIEWSNHKWQVAVSVEGNGETRKDMNKKRKRVSGGKRRNREASRERKIKKHAHGERPFSSTQFYSCRFIHVMQHLCAKYELVIFPQTFLLYEEQVLLYIWPTFHFDHERRRCCAIQLWVGPIHCPMISIVFLQNSSDGERKRDTSPQYKHRAVHRHCAVKIL